MHGGSDDELLNPSRRQNPRQVIAPARQLIRTDELPEDIDESNEVESNDEDFPDVKSDEEDDDDSQDESDLSDKGYVNPRTQRHSSLYRQYEKQYDSDDSNPKDSEEEYRKKREMKKLERIRRNQLINTQQTILSS